MPIKRRRKIDDYIYIRAWGKLLGSKEKYIAFIQNLAVEDNAPLNSVYRRAIGTWCTLDDCNDSMQKTIYSLAHPSKLRKRKLRG